MFLGVISLHDHDEGMQIELDLDARAALGGTHGARGSAHSRVLVQSMYLGDAP